MPAVIMGMSPMLCVSNMTRAIEFYEKLGFTAQRYEGGDGYAFIARDGFELHLAQSNGMIPDQHPGNGIYVYLHKATAAQLEAEFRAAGVKIVSPLSPREWGLNEFVVVDPDTNVLRFGEFLDADRYR